MHTLRLVRSNYNPALAICGILFTMYDGRLNVSRQVVDEVESAKEEMLSETPTVRVPVLA